MVGTGESSPPILISDLTTPVKGEPSSHRETPGEGKSSLHALVRFSELTHDFGRSAFRIDILNPRTRRTDATNFRHSRHQAACAIRTSTSAHTACLVGDGQADASIVQERERQRSLGAGSRTGDGSPNR
jgi:hypothetical protein